MFRKRFLLLNSCGGLLAPVLLLWLAVAQQPQSSKPDFRELEKVALAELAVYSYSNPGYWLAGYLIEAVGGQSYADVLDERLFKPIGMRRTTLRPTMAMTWPLAQGHDVSGRDKPRVVRP